MFLIGPLIFVTLDSIAINSSGLSAVYQEDVFLLLFVNLSEQLQFAFCV
jgi:hypothetical protein